MTNEDQAAVSTVSTYNSRDQLLTEVTGPSTIVNTYDSNGSLTSQSGGGESRTQIWDVRNRLSSASVTKNSVTTNASYLYTSDGIRSSVTENGSKIDYIIDRMTPSGYAQVVEELASGVLVARYTYGASLDPISMNKDTNGSPASLETSLFTGDGYSGVRQAIDIAGAILLSQRFDAFGVKVANTGNLQTPIGYRGERFDSTLGQYYLRARYYDPRQGRFTGVDPYAGNLSDPLQINRYGYAGMNPIGAMDPSGKMLLGGLSARIGISIGIIGLSGVIGGIYSKFKGGSFKTGFILGAFAGLLLASSIFISPLAIHVLSNGLYFGAFQYFESVGAELSGLLLAMAHPIMSSNRKLNQDGNFQIPEKYIPMIQNSPDLIKYKLQYNAQLAAIKNNGDPEDIKNAGGRSVNIAFDERNGVNNNDLFLAIHGTESTLFRRVNGQLQARFTDKYNFEYHFDQNQSTAVDLANLFALIQDIGYVDEYTVDSGWFNI